MQWSRTLYYVYAVCLEEKFGIFTRRCFDFCWKNISKWFLKCRQNKQLNRTTTAVAVLVNVGKCQSGFSVSKHQYNRNEYVFISVLPHMFVMLFPTAKDVRVQTMWLYSEFEFIELVIYLRATRKLRQWNSKCHIAAYIVRCTETRADNKLRVNREEAKTFFTVFVFTQFESSNSFICTFHVLVHMRSVCTSICARQIYWLEKIPIIAWIDSTMCPSVRNLSKFHIALVRKCINFIL